jgi:hypothetical protein
MEITKLFTLNGPAPDKRPVPAAQAALMSHNIKRSPVRLKPLNRPAGHNRYCGPAVISFLTGMTTNDAAAAIRQYSGQRAVRGAHTYHVRPVLHDNGIRTEPVLGLEMRGKTLAGALRRLRSEKRLTEGRVYLIVAGNHFQLVSGRRYACGRVGEIISTADKRIKKRARVEAVYEMHR